MAVFEDKAPWIMALLMRDFGLSVEEAGAILGNAGHESGGFKYFQEIKPTIAGSRGGWGWFQWTGPRRVEFEAYCKRNFLNPSSDRANYSWLFIELKTSERMAIPAVKRAETLTGKVKAFEQKFERAGVKHYASRVDYAQRALKAYKAAKKPIPLPKWARTIKSIQTPSKPTEPTAPKATNRLVDAIINFIRKLFGG